MCKSLIDEIHAFKENREKIMKGMIKIELIDRKFLMQEILNMKAFYETMEKEGVQAIRELKTHGVMGFWKWSYSRFVRKKKSGPLGAATA